ncbi:MAG TPA: GNAT family N-acetyltransferase [Streptosporangiaceae bacterium]|nr:GNAT family N-acetyltransferase [Streptosporangiaceae bacterium]
MGIARLTGAQIRRAAAEDALAVADLAAELAQSFEFDQARFDASYPALMSDENACVLVAAAGDQVIGYLLGFKHLTFYANGPVAWVEEILVRSERRQSGTGRALMTAFEEWAASSDCALVALATRRAKPFYLAIGYEESATYLRKLTQ